ncbi:outer membrane beta-barrel family protein [Pedobacter psychroterrae]|nr:outer membrane beta-barrel family protein [Pedobacter psychroterrae]
MKAKFLFTLILLISIYVAKSQTLQPGITGVILDSIDNKPIEYATLILKESKSDVAKSAIAKADGAFTFTGLRPVEYLLTIVAQGFKTRNMRVDLANTAKSVQDLGALYMIIDVHQLKEVVVKENKPLAKQEIDRITYNIQADPESKSANILEIMRKVPLLSVDGDNTIRLKGNTNYKIFINGKPSTIVNRNPQDILRNMPASGIDKLEVITTVPAKYDAEALDGIINIITTKKISDGYLGNVNVSHRFPVGGPGMGGSFTFKDGKFGVSGFLGGSLFDSPPTTNLTKRYTSTTTLLQSTGVDAEGKNGYLGSDLSYEIDSLNLLSGQFNIGGNNNRNHSDLQSSLTSAADLVQNYGLVSNNKLNGANLDASLNYQMGFKSDKNRQLTFSYRILNTNNDRFGNFDVADEVSYASTDYNQKNDERSLEQSFQVDYAHPFKKLTLEAGVKGTIRNNKSNFLYDTLGTNQEYVMNEALSNKFRNTQDIIGVYNSYQYKMNDWGFKAGVRLEHATIDADFIANHTQIKRSYFDYIPSVSVQKQFKNNTSLLFGYSRKIRRPEIQHLNPFVDRSNPNFESSGNPNLRPASSNSLELSYSSFKKLSLYIRLNYDFYAKMVMPAQVYDAVNNITKSTLENSGRMRMVMSNVNVSYPITSRWNVNANLLTIYGQVDGMVNNTVVRNQRLMYYFSASSSYRFDKGWRATGSVNLNGADINLQGIENSPYRGCGFSVTKELMKDKCYFTAEASNPFSKYRNNTGTTSAPTFYQERTNQRYLRSFSASLNYRFGGLKSSLKKSKKGISNDDNGISPY